MQTNQYEEIEKLYQEVFECFSTCYLEKMRKWMESTQYWETKEHYEKRV